MSRAFGGRSLTTFPPTRTVPEVMSSSPAIIRSADVLPQPDGPTKTTNSPSATSRSSSLDGARPVRVDLRQPVELDRSHGGTILAIWVTFPAEDGSGRNPRGEPTPTAPVPAGAPRFPCDAPDRPCGAVHRSARRARRSCSRSTSASPTRPRARSAVRWVGLANFRHLLDDPIFVDAIWHTFLFTAISQAIVVLCAGLIAHALDPPVPGPLDPALHDPAAVGGADRAHGDRLRVDLRHAGEHLHVVPGPAAPRLRPEPPGVARHPERTRWRRSSSSRRGGRSRSRP